MPELELSCPFSPPSGLKLTVLVLVNLKSKYFLCWLEDSPKDMLSIIASKLWGNVICCATFTMILVAGNAFIKMVHKSLDDGNFSRSHSACQGCELAISIEDIHH